MKKLMKMNIKNFCYTDAIFYADKLLHLQSVYPEKLSQAVYDLGNIDALFLAHCYYLNKEFLRVV